VFTVFFDAGPIITACKFESLGKLVVDHLLSGCCIMVATSVEEEVAVLGAGYPDGAVAGERIAEGFIKAAERRKMAGGGEGITQFLGELINLGFEHRLEQLYRQFETGKISLGYFASEMGLGVRDLYAALEQRGLPTSNIGAKPSVSNG
jgi:hypothetical protein